MADMQQLVNDFEKSRMQLMNVSSQRQNFQVQSDVIDESLEELGKTKEKKVYKAVGNILILSDIKDVEKELKEQKETTSLRLKTMKKQEESLVEKLNKLKSEIEAIQKGKSDSKKEKE
jgi:prefoldin beta subunit